MALKGHLTADINQVVRPQAGVTTCFGLPATNPNIPAMCSCTFTVHVAVYDSGNVYVGLNGQVFQNTIVNDTYPVKMCVSPNNWNWVVSGGVLQGPSGSWTANISVTDGNFNWTFSCGNPAQNEPAGTGYVLAGTISQFHGSTEGDDGYLYLSGTGTYQLDTPIYPQPVRISVPGFKAFINYFPFATRKSNDWKSCNRSGGYVQSYESGQWKDKKNSTGEGSTIFYYDGSKWVVCPKIGSE